ncbi:MAG TPA: precorrin-3B C(17)-methyltransferase [Epulopiscium sp.]|nr:precorrin-3B C(17)-methyltransferase [Candidatus Epulonipiscium sp.]
MGKLYVIGMGPGGLDHMSKRALDCINESDVIVGYNKYIEFLQPILGSKEIHQTGMTKEIDRCKEALRLSKDHIVSLISTGDAGVYGMAGLALELRVDEEIEVIPGITAACSAASVLGAPLMHDHCNISLSDLMTPYELIQKRIKNAAEADFVISLYNPRSKGRPHYLMESIDIIRQYRDKSTPVGIVKNALREGQVSTLTTLENFDDTKVDMMSIVVIGNSTSYIKDGRFITKRGYENKR